MLSLLAEQLLASSLLTLVLVFMLSQGDNLELYWNTNDSVVFHGLLVKMIKEWLLNAYYLLEARIHKSNSYLKEL